MYECDQTIDAARAELRERGGHARRVEMSATKVGMGKAFVEVGRIAGQPEVRADHKLDLAFLRDQAANNRAPEKAAAARHVNPFHRNHDPFIRNPFLIVRSSPECLARGLGSTSFRPPAGQSQPGDYVPDAPPARDQRHAAQPVEEAEDDAETYGNAH